MKKVTYIIRKAQPIGNFSVEVHFREVAAYVKAHMEIRFLFLPFVSKGIWRKVLNLLYVLFHRGEVNHVTGDITYVALALLGKKSIITILDCVSLQGDASLKSKIIKLLWYYIPIKYSAHTTVISESIRREVVSLFPRYADKIKTVYFAGNQIVTKYEKIFNRKRPMILQIGTAHNKNIENTLKALREFECEFVIIGRHIDNLDGFKTRYLNITQINKPLTDREIFEYYKAADIISFPSLYEGFGMPIVEGNTIGRVVVTSKIGATKEIASHAAILVDPYSVESIFEGFITARDDVQTRNDVILKGYANAKRFSALKAASQYLALYEE